MGESPSYEKRAVHAEKWVYGGQTLSRDAGQVILTPFALPGEQITVLPVRRKPGLLEARLVSIDAAAAERIDPRCPLFTRCGGCDYQHAPYEYQLARKAEIVREVFRRVGKFEAPEPARVLTGEPWGYRNRVQFHITKGQIGYQAAGSHQLVALDGDCPIAAPALNQALAGLRKALPHRMWPRFVRSLELFTNGKETLLNIGETDGGQRVARSFFDWIPQQVPGANLGALEYEAGGHTYRVSHGSFFQTNRFLVEALCEEALRHATGERALELYAGVGLFTLPLARKVVHLDAVESSASAVRDLEFNLARAKAAAKPHRASADLFLETLAPGHDFVLADPPRSGLGKTVVKQLLRLAPRRVTLVSCDPATQARDLAALLAGGYQLAEYALADLFPHTFHIETVAHLERE